MRFSKADVLWETFEKACIASRLLAGLILIPEFALLGLEQKAEFICEITEEIRKKMGEIIDEEVV